VTLEYFIDKGFHIDFDIIASLVDVDAIIHINVSLPLDWDGEFVIDEVYANVGCLGIWSCDSKVIHLAHEEDTISIEDARVKAGLVDRGCEADFMENFIGVFFP
jgi:hypothetical protein